MRTNQALVVVGAALLTAAVIVVVALLAFNTGTKNPAGPAAGRPAPTASTSTSTAPASPPAPTVTVTRHQAPPATHAAPPPPQISSEDEEFLELIAADGIKAPDDWAIKAGHKTCGQSYDDAYRYLTDGGLHGDHVQTFLDDWTIAHGGSC